MSGEVKGVIVSYRRSKVKQYNNQVLVKLFVEPKYVAQYIGSRIIVKDNYGNTYRGRIIRVHSRRNSVVVAVFKPNIPGQVLGSVALISKR